MAAIVPLSVQITTVAELGTAIGTLILAIATFGATRSANRSARIAEKSLLVGLRPTLVPSRPEDRSERVDFAAGGDTHTFDLRGGRAIVEQEDGSYFLAISLRNIGTGAAQIQGWYLRRGFMDAATPHVDPDDFRPQRRSLYISPGDSGFWQGGIREESDPLREIVEPAIADDDWLAVELLYTDPEIGRRFVTRFSLRPEDDDWYPVAGIHWTLD